CHHGTYPCVIPLRGHTLPNRGYGPQQFPPPQETAMTAPLRERDGALALLASAAERARAGTGGLVLLRGATGTGRTAVLERAARHAEGLGLRVLHARCSPDYSSVPFGTLLHLLDAPEDAGPAPDGTRGAAERLWRLLLSYTAETPLLLAVDDAHLLDDHSRRWLADAARRIDRLPVLVVATEGVEGRRGGT